MRPELGGRGWKLAVTTGQTDVRPMKSRVCKDRGKGKTSPEVGRSLTEKNINQNIVLMQYAVRGPLVIRTGVIETELQQGAQKPFKRVIRANIGDAHAMGQTPITYIRQVIAMVAHPELIESSNLPKDAKDQARQILCGMSGHSAGAYTMSCGVELIRKNVAAYIEKRDGHKCDFNNVCLTTGATTGIKMVLELLCSSIDGKCPAVMVPIPQYPLYSATLVEYGLGQVGYFLDEDNNWGLDMQELERAHAEASKTQAVRAIVVINPGNPTGQVLTRKNIEDVIKFAYKHKMMLLADEVYQHNIYAEGCQFFSFKKVITEMGAPYCKEQELVSFMSISKGYMGECGLRGGWMEIINLDPAVQAHLYKALSAILCPTSLGQAAVDCVAKPPAEGSPSYEQWLAEKTCVLDSLAQRSKIIYETFKNMKGFKCNVVQGAMYAFPRIELSPKAIEAAKKANRPPDVFYAYKLLEETGICVVPGTGFGQKPNTHHFRTTILPQTELLAEMMDIFQKFHKKFTDEFA
ncbi:alanine aminotransferase 1-like isoform X3 [Trichoplusia ni]|nr:alanine aminotransferase 1-like isoform X3 [Trichoplusia ni]